MTFDQWYDNQLEIGAFAKFGFTVKQSQRQREFAEMVWTDAFEEGIDYQRDVEHVNRYEREK